MSGLSWSEMHPAEFDGSKAPRRERKFIAEAPDTLFPRLMPEPKPAPRTTTAELPGQAGLFGDDL